jgi:hypothetical protein
MKNVWFGRRAALGLEVLRSMRRSCFDSVVRVNGLTVTVGNEALVMPSITVEPFTARVLVTNVDHVSSVGGIHEQPILLAPGRATVSALSGRRNLHARAKS